MWHDEAFHAALRNTLYYCAASVPLGTALALGLALLMNRRWAGMGLFRTIFFVPSLVSGVAIVLVWGWLFNPRYGAINGLLGALGLPQPGWLTDPRWAMPTIVLLGLWSIGGIVVIYLAGLQTVPVELYDVARIDGAGRWSTFRHITLPLVSPITFFLLVVGTIGSLQVFAPTYILTEGGPENSTLTLPLYIYQNAFSWQKYGYASALTVVLICVALSLTLMQLLLARRWVFYTGWGGR
jgi:multiple sugar transport system permease protein